MLRAGSCARSHGGCFAACAVGKRDLGELKKRYPRAPAAAKVMSRPAAAALGLSRAADTAGQIGLRPEDLSGV